MLRSARLGTANAISMSRIGALTVDWRIFPVHCRPPLAFHITAFVTSDWTWEFAGSLSTRPQACLPPA